MATGKCHSFKIDKPIVEKRNFPKNICSRPFSFVIAVYKHDKQFHGL